MTRNLANSQNLPIFLQRTRHFDSTSSYSAMTQLASLRDQEHQLLKDMDGTGTSEQLISMSWGTMQEKEEILTKLKGWDEEIAWKKYAAAVLQHSGEKRMVV